MISVVSRVLRKTRSASVSRTKAFMLYLPLFSMGIILKLNK